MCNCTAHVAAAVSDPILVSVTYPWRRGRSVERKGLNAAAFLALLLLRHPQQPFTEAQSNLMVLFICQRLQPADL